MILGVATLRWRLTASSTIYTRKTANKLAKFGFANDFSLSG